MKIIDFLAPTDVVIDMRVPQKKQLLLELARKAGAPLGLQADYVASELLKREELGSTGMGKPLPPSLLIFGAGGCACPP